MVGFPESHVEGLGSHEPMGMGSYKPKVLGIVMM